MGVMMEQRLRKAIDWCHQSAEQS